MRIQNHTIEITIIISLLSFFLYFCHTHQFIKFMTGILGKIIIIGLIIFYTSINKIYGILFCLIVILFYQLDTTKWVSEGFFNMDSLGTCGKCECGKCNNCLNFNLNNNNNYLSVIDLEDNLISRKKSEFQKRHCGIDGNLNYKELPVKKEITDIIFPEIKYNNENDRCNLCDKNCDFNVIS